MQATVPLTVFTFSPSILQSVCVLLFFVTRPGFIWPWSTRFHMPGVSIKYVTLKSAKNCVEPSFIPGDPNENMVECDQY